MRNGQMARRSEDLSPGFTNLKICAKKNGNEITKAATKAVLRYNTQPVEAVVAIKNEVSFKYGKSGRCSTLKMVLEKYAHTQNTKTKIQTILSSRARNSSKCSKNGKGGGETLAIL